MTSPVWPLSFDGLLRAHLPLCGPDQTIEADRSLADLGLDSLKMVSLLMALEDAYEITFPDELLAANTFATAGSLWEGIRSVTNQSGNLITQ